MLHHSTNVSGRQVMMADSIDKVVIANHVIRVRSVIRMLGWRVVYVTISSLSILPESRPNMTQRMQKFLPPKNDSRNSLVFSILPDGIRS